MIPFILSQLAIIAYALFIGHKEVQAIRMVRDYVPTPNPYNEPFHFYGYGAAFVVGAVVTLFQQSVEAFIIVPFLVSMWYSMLYDGVIGDEIYDDFTYLGNSSKIDKWFKHKFGVFAGKWKLGVIIFLIVVLNLIYFL
jgi:hypothetical protein